MRGSICLLLFWSLSAVASAETAPDSERIACPDTPTAYDPNARMPPSAEPRHTEVVEMRVVIDADGRVVDAKVVKSTNPGLDGISIAAVRKWKYAKHDVRDGMACIEATVQIKYEP